MPLAGQIRPAGGMFDTHGTDEAAKASLTSFLLLD